MKGTDTKPLIVVMVLACLALTIFYFGRKPGKTITSLNPSMLTPMIIPPINCSSSSTMTPEESLKKSLLIIEQQQMTITYLQQQSALLTQQLIIHQQELQKLQETMSSAVKQKEVEVEKEKEKEKENYPPPVKQAIADAILTMKENRVISFGLYGSSDRYIVGAYRNAELAPSVFPGWRVRFYHDRTVPEEAVNRLKSMGCEMVLMETQGGIAGMFWRFLVADDPKVDRYIIRDSDSRISDREARAVDEWIRSGKKYHILRDHPSHSGYSISGGIWGGVHNPAINFGELMANFPKSEYVQDMNFLGDIIYPKIKADVWAHDAYSCKKFPNSHPFPTPRIWTYHIGQVFDKDDRGRDGDIQILRNAGQESPECRPKWPFAT